MDPETYNLDNLNASQFRELLKNPRFYDAVTNPNKYGNLTPVVQDASIFAGFNEAKKTNKFKKCLGVRRDERSSVHNLEGTRCCSPFARGYLAHKGKKNLHDCGYAFTGTPSDMEPDEKIITLPGFIQAMAEVPIAETPEQIEERLERERLETQQRLQQETEEKERRRIQLEQNVERELQAAREAAREAATSQPLITTIIPQQLSVREDTVERSKSALKREKKKANRAKREAELEAEAQAEAEARAQAEAAEEEQRKISFELNEKRIKEVEKAKFEVNTIKNIVKNALEITDLNEEMFGFYYTEMLHNKIIDSILLDDETGYNGLLSIIRQTYEDPEDASDLIKIMSYLKVNKQDLKIPLEYQHLYDEDLIEDEEVAGGAGQEDLIINSLLSPEKAQKIFSNPQLHKRYKKKIRDVFDAIQQGKDIGKAQLDILYSDQNRDVIGIRKAYGNNDRRKAIEIAINARDLKIFINKLIERELKKNKYEEHKVDNVVDELYDANNKEKNMKIIKEVLGNDEFNEISRKNLLNDYHGSIQPFIYLLKTKQGLLNAETLKQRLLDNLRKNPFRMTQEDIKNIEKIYNSIIRSIMDAHNKNLLKKILGEDEYNYISSPERKKDFSIYRNAPLKFIQLKKAGQPLEVGYEMANRAYEELVPEEQRDANYMNRIVRIGEFIYQNVNYPDARPSGTPSGPPSEGGKKRSRKYKKTKKYKNRNKKSRKQNKNKTMRKRKLYYKS